MIVAQMTSYPGRMDAMLLAIKSIAPQVHLFRLVLNEYGFDQATCDNFAQTISSLYGCKAEVFSPEQNYKALGKFYDPVKTPAFILTVDDDILYPPDYAEVMTYMAANTNGMVCVHGSNFTDASNYMRSVYHFSHALHAKTRVQMAGCGTLCYLNTNIQFDADLDFPQTQKTGYVLDDQEIALKAKKLGVNIYAVKRYKMWLKPIPTEGKSVWGSLLNNFNHRDAAIQLAIQLCDI